MSDAARLARQAYEMKPSGMPYRKFSIDLRRKQEITEKIDDAIRDAAYASAISYAEALTGVRSRSSSWSIIRLYYSCFYSIRALLLVNNVISFNGGDEMLLDLDECRFLKGGRSSHHWNWFSLRSACGGAKWFCSQDSENAYGNIRTHRENVNYTHSFTDPELHNCLIFNDWELGRRIKNYRDDEMFLYTYLQEHLAIAYPTKLIFYLGDEVRRRGLSLQAERAAYLRRIWGFPDGCPIL